LARVVFNRLSNCGKNNSQTTGFRLSTKSTYLSCSIKPNKATAVKFRVACICFISVPIFQRTVIILTVIGVWGLSAQAQEDEYYRASKRIKPKVILPNKDLITTNNHWYIGLEGGGKWNGSALENSLSGLLAYRKSFTAGYYALQLGYNHNLRWAFESGYIQDPTNAFLYFFTTRGRAISHLNDLSHTIPLRVKRRVLRIGNVQKQSGIYIGTGVLVSPFEQPKNLEKFNLLIGYTRVEGSNPLRFDTLVVRSQSLVTGRNKLALEGSLEFVGRIARHWELVSYGRVRYTPNSALRSESILYLNSFEENKTALSLHPWSVQFGIAIRYLYTIKNAYRSRYE